MESNLRRAGYRITVYTPNEGVLEIDSNHKANAGVSIDYSPTGQQLYAAVYETAAPGVRAALIKRNSDETPPVVRSDLVFTISGTAAELQTIVKDATTLLQPARRWEQDRHRSRSPLPRFRDKQRVADVPGPQL